MDNRAGQQLKGSFTNRGACPGVQLVVEPSGAVGLAAALSSQLGEHPALERCRRVGVVLCGGNADLGEALWRQWLP